MRTLQSTELLTISGGVMTAETANQPIGNMTYSEFLEAIVDTAVLFSEEDPAAIIEIFPWVQQYVDYL